MPWVSLVRVVLLVLDAVIDDEVQLLGGLCFGLSRLPWARYLFLWAVPPRQLGYLEAVLGSFFFRNGMGVTSSLF
jgi:hypothetical protein